MGKSHMDSQYVDYCESTGSLYGVFLAAAMVELLLAAYIVAILHSKVEEQHSAEAAAAASSISPRVKRSRGFVPFYVLIAILSICRSFWFVLIMWQCDLYYNASVVQNVLIGYPTLLFVSVELALLCSWFECFRMHFPPNSPITNILSFLTRGNNFLKVNMLIYAAGTAYEMIYALRYVMYVCLVLQFTILAVLYAYTARVMYKDSRDYQTSLVKKKTIITLVVSSICMTIRSAMDAFDAWAPAYIRAPSHIDDPWMQVVYYMALEVVPLVATLFALHVIKTSMKSVLTLTSAVSSTHAALAVSTGGEYVAAGTPALYQSYLNIPDSSDYNYSP